MRISDQMLANKYLTNMNATKSKMGKLQQQIATQQKINNPSDSPSGTASLIRLGSQFESTQTYINSITRSLAFLNETQFAMDTMQNELNNVMVKLVDFANPTAQQNNALFADQIDKSLSIIMDLANYQSDGKYIFGGTDTAKAPFLVSDDGNSVSFASNSSGEQKIKTSTNITQKINISGRELLGTIVSESGAMDKTAALGSVVNSSTKIYDATGNEYTLNMQYLKLDNNKYQFSYDIVDGDLNSIYGALPSSSELLFDDATGNLKTINGESPTIFDIKVPENKINFSIDMRSLKENAAPSSITTSVNQKNDIFNTLIIIREKIKAGEVPDEDLTNQVKTFFDHLLNKTSEVGAMINQLGNTEEMLNNQMTNMQNLAASINEVDLAKAILELQQQDYLLQFSNKVASMILPRSILDYM